MLANRTLQRTKSSPLCPGLGSVAVGAENRTQARRLCYLRFGDVPYAPASHRSLGASLHQVTKLLSLTLSLLDFLDPSSQIALVLFAQGLGVRFAVRIKEFLSALLPRRSEFGRCNVPVRPAFLGNGP